MKFGFSVRTFKTAYTMHSKVRSSPRPISDGPLHPLLDFHSRPIYLVVFKGTYYL